jgi:ADP-heptose:LPS heptosyltransferase
VDNYVLIWGAGIGDLVVSLPAIAGIRSGDPSGTLSLVGTNAQRSTMRWVLEMGYVDEVVVQEPGLGGSVRLMVRLAASRRARLFSLHTVRSAKIPWGLALLRHVDRNSTGFRSQGFLEKVLTGNKHSSFSPDSELRQEYARMGDTLGGTAPDLAPGSVRTAALSWAKDLNETAPPPDGITIGLHLGARPDQEVKTLRRNNWDPLIQAFRDQGARFVMIGGPDESSDLPGPWNDSVDRNLVGQLNIAESAVEISKCDLFLCSDGGPMHIAGLFNVPTVAYFGPTDPVRHRPLTDNFYLIEPGCWCQHTSHQLGMVTCPNSDGPICRDTVLDHKLVDQITKWADTVRP